MGLKKSKKYVGLEAKQLKWEMNVDELDLDRISPANSIEGIIGQEKAIKALQVGIEIKSPGYNIFITGLSGTGKLTTIKKVLEVISPIETELKDYVYVNNFSDTDRPILLEFPAGKGNKFKKDMAQAVKFLVENIPLILENEPYMNRKKKLIEVFGENQQKLYLLFESKLRKDGFALGQSQSPEVPQPEILIAKEDKLYYIQQIDELMSNNILTKKEAIALTKKYSDYKQELQIILKKSLFLNKEFQVKLFELEKEYTNNIITVTLDEVKLQYDTPKVADYLNQVKEAIFETMDVFAGHRSAEESTAEGVTIDYLKSFEVNVILDNSEGKGRPVIVETYPTFNNIFGTIDKMSDGQGGWYSDFTKIKAGSLLRANNGYLILRALDSFNEHGVWNTLKRVLLYGYLELQDQGSIFQISSGVLKPEPIKIDTKIIFLGNNNIYNMLSSYEDDFNKIFKIKAEFDYEMKKNEKSLNEYVSVINTIIKKEELLKFNTSAINKLFEYSARYAGNKNKLTTRFAYIVDLMLEANFWAKNEGASEVVDKHIRQAFETAAERHGMGNNKITEMIEEGQILIDTTGERVGQINGLAVYGDGIYSFGKPTRITASVSIGTGNIINVERESGLSGSSYNKGVLIISGYIKEKFGKNIPLNFNASLVFEQGYGMIDGDSASIAEIAVLISCLSEIPIQQQFAVTGSVNQKGDVQPIGGVNEKVEGFFEICKMQGLTGKQGAIIPHSNVDDLMLNDDVIDAVKKGMFHIYSISRVEEALEILMGVKVGNILSTGKFEADTIFGKVEHNLIEMLKKQKTDYSKISKNKPKPKVKSKTK